jgi:hypothetical protein
MNEKDFCAQGYRPDSLISSQSVLVISCFCAVHALHANTAIEKLCLAFA